MKQVTATILLLLPLAAFAHHSKFGRFDTGSFAELEGEIVDILWRNPHILFQLSVTGRDGIEDIWELEATASSSMRRYGVAPDVVAIGDVVKVAGFPPAADNKELYVHNLLLPDGRELLMGTRVQPRWSGRIVGDAATWLEAGGDVSRPDLGIFRVWGFTPGSPVILPEQLAGRNFDINSYPLTDSARAALAEFDLATDDPTLNCTPKGMPTIMSQPYPMECFQTGNDISLHIEEYDLVRTIHLGDAPALEEAPFTPLGYSLGEWDDGTLVVTTTRVSWPYFDQVGIPQSEDVRIVERFTPSNDGSRLNYWFSVTDPATFTEPVQQEKYWIWRPDETVEPFDCYSVN